MSNILCLTWPVTSQVTSRSNFQTLSERSRPGLSIAVWIFPLRLLVSEIDGGGRYGHPPPPPPAEGRVRTRPSRARVKECWVLRSRCIAHSLRQERNTPEISNHRCFFSEQESERYFATVAYWTKGKKRMLYYKPSHMTDGVTGHRYSVTII